MRRLHIGGEQRKDGWEILNIVPGPAVDHLGDARDLSRFHDHTFGELYASHVLEHLDYQDGELLNTLREWHRVLTPGGRLFLSVPDLDTLARLFLDKTQFNTEGRFRIMRMIFGGHMDEYDYHMVGLNLDILAVYLREAGFSRLRQVPEFGLFDDDSLIQVNGQFISLNVIVEKAG